MDCSICLQIPDDPKTTECCSKDFCRQCLMNWFQIKNICPLCATIIGKQLKNNLKPQQQYHPQINYLEQQLKVINQRLTYENNKLKKWEAEANSKSGVSYYRIKLLNEQLKTAEDYQEVMKVAMERLDGATASVYSQLLTELIIEMENQKVVYHNFECRQENYYSDEEYKPCYNIRESGSKREKQRKKKNDAKTKRIQTLDD